MTLRSALLSLLILPACLPLAGSPTDEDEPANPRTLTVHWTLRNPDGSVAACPAGFGTLGLYSEPATSSGGFTDLFPCASQGTFERTLYTQGLHQWGEGLVTEYAPEYTEVLYLTDPTGEVERAVSLGTPIDLAAGDGTIDIDLYPDAGLGVMTWELASGVGGRVHSCAAVEIDTIEYRYRPFEDEAAPLTTDRWPCTSVDPVFTFDDSIYTGNGRMRMLPPGNYVGTIVALRGGVEIAIDDDVHMEVRTGNAVTERTTSLVIEDR